MATVDLEGLVLEAEVQVDELKTVASGPMHDSLPPDEPPRHLPTIGHFGPYDIVGRLALGGMAEILLAREEAQGAGSRYLVVKRILPEYERDQSFVDMFLDEARVMMRLKHPNVCHVYKFGQQDGTHFIAMEWVNGASLGKLIRRARKAGGLPVAVACKIIASIAEALDHAHQARDDHDRPLGIVHRDVTPDNLMISYDGSVKLLDFGIAKADARAHKTQAGVVKGKFAYMAPEQCRAKELDHRVDIFALGVCLFEALTGRPLYRRDTEFETMEAIVRGPIPKLADRMPDPPPELERIIAKCLAKKPDDRFASAAALQDALDRFLASRGEVVNARRLKELMTKLFREEMKRGPTVDTTPFGSSYHLGTSDGPALTGTTGLESLPVPELDLAPIPPTPPALEGNAVPPYSAIGMAGGGGVPDDYRPGAGAPRPADNRPAPTAPPRVVRAPSAPEPSGGALKWVLIGLGAVALVAGGAYVALTQLMPADEGPVVPGPAPVLTGTLIVDSEPSGATLFVDDQEIGPTPATVPRLATGSHRVRLVLEGHTEHQGDVELRAGQTRRVVQTLTPLTPDGPAQLGRLSLTSRPRAEVYLGNRHLGSTPLSNLEVPAGVLALELVTPDGERHRRGVMVRAEDTTSTHLDLTRQP
jgi:serine/threonine-protein kinase